MDLDPVFDPLDLTQDGRVMEHASLPVPFEAMDPAMMGEPLWENLNIPSGVFHFYQDVDFLFDDIFHDLPPEHKHGHQQGRLTQHLLGNNTRDGHILGGSPPPDLSQATPTSIQSDTRVPGYEAFQKSPWLWAPVRQDHAYAESQQLSVNEAQLMETSEVEETARVSPRMPKMAHPSTRDEILSLALKFSQSNLKIRSFPSFNLLNIQIQAFFVRQSTLIDAWIHVASFNPDQCHSELLAGVVAAGSTLFAVPNVWKMGLALQEIVRLATCDAIDRDNRRARDLQSIQSFVLWGDIGLWSGFRRKMEIGEGFAHTVPTMLRRAGAFRRNYYPPIETPTADDDEDVLRQKWLALVLQVFINDMRSSIAFNRNPILSPVEMTFTLPAPRDLWDARDPFEWRARYLSKPNRQVTISLVDGMQTPSKLDSEIELIDIELSTHAILYGLWGRVHSFFDAKAFALRDSSSAPRSTSNLWVEAQRQDLQQKIRAAHTKLGWIYPLSAEADLIGHFLLMSLHVSSDDIQAFAGRYGEEELRQAIPRLREWGHSEDKYSTLWHAGQVLKAARSYPPTLLRGFHAIAVYHACLSLWIASIISSKEPSSASQVVLDGDETPGVQRFIATGHGRPCLHVGDGLGELEDPLIISVVLLEVFTKNFPSRSHPIPPLLENLVSLMGDISRVQTRIPE
ncbi:C2H2 type zinc finger domain protein [Colletotrichum asianum]|uniref:C2H2 type zinc finger domain protein n=1 Tax=Colletotrichum asianum TaxID=702518 RepID=A0A8H3ZR07_9PEZI|nr:C2H2 type zinc finger domain protein [Colletotrichum asianum]